MDGHLKGFLMELVHCLGYLFGDCNKSLGFLIGDNSWLVYNCGFFMVIKYTCEGLYKYRG